MNKVIGSICVVLGVVELWFSYTNFFVVIPRLNELNQKFSVDTSQAMNTRYLIPILLLCFGITNIVLGLANFDVLIKNRNELALKLGSISIFVSLFASAILLSFMVQSSLGPIYSPK